MWQLFQQKSVNWRKRFVLLKNCLHHVQTAELQQPALVLYYASTISYHTASHCVTMLNQLNQRHVMLALASHNYIDCIIYSHCKKRNCDANSQVAKCLGTWWYRWLLDAFEELLLTFWIRPATWLLFVHEIAVPISWSPQHSWWRLVLPKMHHAQWVTT